jgi:hypothetical protein
MPSGSTRCCRRWGITLAFAMEPKCTRAVKQLPQQIIQVIARTEEEAVNLSYVISSLREPSP